MRPFVHVHADPLISEEAVFHLIDESTRRLEGITERTGIPNINTFGSRGFKGLKDLSLFPPSSLRKATSKFLSKVADGLKAPLRDYFLKICRVDDHFFTDFISFVRHVVPSVDLKGLMNCDSQFGERDLSVFAYAVYQDPANTLNKFNQIKSPMTVPADALVAAMHSYAERFEQLAHFFLYEPWFNSNSITDILSAYWGQEFGLRKIPLDVLPLGFPDAYYKVSWSDKIVNLFEPLDNGGEEILSRLSTQMANALTTCLHVTMNVEIYAKDIKYRILSWDYLKELGFFRSEPCVQIDAGTPILEMVEVLTHELTHHVYHNLTDTNFIGHGNAFCRVDSPCLNEGFAEYHTEYCLKEVFKNYPELDYFRLVRRILLHSEDNRDSHVLGAALMHSINDGKSAPDHTLMHNLLNFCGFRLENLQVTPGFKLSIEPKKGGIEPKVTLVEIPTPEFIDQILSVITVSSLHF